MRTCVILSSMRLMTCRLAVILGREKPYTSVARNFWCPTYMYGYVLVDVRKSVTAPQAAQIFVDNATTAPSRHS
ncbi:hypothetical protein PF011_g1882 [Phytophthora fragariae]|uniref:Secreted protein n=1 Tax=Phytophthora fragariae TaxID=53985 RepID=A0A6A3M6I5_9STRA|nr:hypothetical protein PF011_g1882 [Phytophthora fragariae]